MKTERIKKWLQNLYKKLHVVFKVETTMFFFLCWDNHDFYIINGTSLNVCSTQNIYKYKKVIINKH